MTFCCNLKREALTTRCDSNCMLADGEEIDSWVRPSEEETDNGSFYFSTTHSSGRKELACCLNLRQTSSECLGHGTSHCHCHCGKGLLQHVCVFRKIFFLLKPTNSFSSIIFSCYESSMSQSEVFWFWLLTSLIMLLKLNLWGPIWW